MNRAIVRALTGLLITAASPNAVQADTVDIGWDLFITQTPGTTFGGFPFEGVPLGTFDFGSGLVATDDTDTIMERMQQAAPGIDNVPGGSLHFSTPPPGNTGLIEIELVALQLKSVDPIDLGAGTAFHYVTLQSGTPSAGEMSITFDGPGGGTFDSFFDVFFDVRFGALDGQIISSDSFSMTSSGNDWGRLPPPGAIEISGVNTYLNGSDRDADFWPLGDVQHDASGAAHHTIDPVPEPAAISLLAVGALLVVRRLW